MVPLSVVVSLACYSNCWMYVQRFLVIVNSGVNRVDNGGFLLFKLLLCRALCSANRRICAGPNLCKREMIWI